MVIELFFGQKRLKKCLTKENNKALLFSFFINEDFSTPPVHAFCAVCALKAGGG
jgi:hypothetical protein